MTLPTPDSTPQIQFPIRATAGGPITNDENDISQGHFGIKTVDGGGELWYRPISDLVGDPVPDPVRVAENADLELLIAAVVNKTDFDSDNTILVANTADTPTSLVVPENTIVGRITSGTIDALTATEVKTLLATTLQNIIDINGTATLATGVPLQILDASSDALLSLLSTGSGPSDNDVTIGNSATSDITVQGNNLNLKDVTYETTLTEIVEDISNNLTQVEHDESLFGDGSAESPIGVVRGDYLYLKSMTNTTGSPIVFDTQTFAPAVNADMSHTVNYFIAGTIKDSLITNIDAGNFDCFDQYGNALTDVEAAAAVERMVDRRWRRFFYVNGTTGSDVTGDGSFGNPYATITKGYETALAQMLYTINGSATLIDGFCVKVANGTYTDFPETINLEFLRNGWLSIDGYEGPVTDSGPFTVTTALENGTSETIDLVSTGAGWTTDEHYLKYVLVTSGTAAGYTLPIYKNSADTIPTLKPLIGTLSPGDTFNIVTPGVLVNIDHGITFDTRNTHAWTKCQFACYNIAFENSGTDAFMFQGMNSAAFPLCSFIVAGDSYIAQMQGGGVNGMTLLDGDMTSGTGGPYAYLYSATHFANESGAVPTDYEEGIYITGEGGPNNGTDLHFVSCRNGVTVVGRQAFLAGVLLGYVNLDHETKVSFRWGYVDNQFNSHAIRVDDFTVATLQDLYFASVNTTAVYVTDGSSVIGNSIDGLDPGTVFSLGKGCDLLLETAMDLAGTTQDVLFTRSGLAYSFADNADGMWFDSTDKLPINALKKVLDAQESESAIVEGGSAFKLVSSDGAGGEGEDNFQIYTGGTDLLNMSAVLDFITIYASNSINLVGTGTDKHLTVKTEGASANLVLEAGQNLTLADKNTTSPIVFSDSSNTALNTTNKTLIGAVNEVHASGGGGDMQDAYDNGGSFELDDGIPFAVNNPDETMLEVLYETGETEVKQITLDALEIFIDGSTTMTGSASISGSSVTLASTGALTFKDQYTPSAVALADSSNTAYNTTNKTSIGAVNEIHAALGDPIAYTFQAWDFEEPNNSDWAVNALAPLAVDSNNAAMRVRLFDDTTPQGIGFTERVPAGKTNIILDLFSRAETSAASNLDVVLTLYVREIPDNGAVESWSAGTNLTTLTMGTSNEYFQYDTQTIALSTLSITAGNLIQIELVRDTADAGDTLVGDYALKMGKLRFS